MLHCTPASVHTSEYVLHIVMPLWQLCWLNASQFFMQGMQPTELQLHLQAAVEAKLDGKLAQGVSTFAGLVCGCSHVMSELNKL